MNVDDLDAPESPATLAPTRPAPPPLQQAALPGYTLFARVLVKTTDQQALSAALVGDGLTHAPVDPSGAALRDWRVIACDSVRSAGVLADRLSALPFVLAAEVDAARPTGERSIPNDPSIPQQWYLNNAVLPISDLNVLPAWDAGFTGAGITIGIIDRGFDAAHPDLSSNYLALASQASTSFTSHGTACAGLVAMSGNNQTGGAGVAFHAKLGRLYYGSTSTNAVALVFRHDLNAIKSNSWGPNDDARIDTIAAIELDALRDAATLGRGGLGTVIVWAAGNGALISDRCDYDQYASSRYAICVGALGNNDRRADYSEPGASLMLVANSANDDLLSNSSGVFSTTPNGSYTTTFGGTSAACPLAAGTVALMLQANPALTWRDVAHVLINSARRCDPDSPGWTTNGAGFAHSHDYGFGAVDAHAAVTLAQSWTNVPPETAYTLPPQEVALSIPDAGEALTSAISVGANIVLERVQVKLYAIHPHLGDLRIELVAPSGMTSVLAEPRFDSSTGYAHFTFTSLRHWGEDPRGVWTLRIADEQLGDQGTWTDWQLALIGHAPPCPCDWDRSGDTTIQDLFEFLSDWFAGTGDFSNDQTHSVDDIFQFLACWFALPGGC